MEQCKPLIEGAGSARASYYHGECHKDDGGDGRKGATFHDAEAETVHEVRLCKLNHVETCVDNPAFCT